MERIISSKGQKCSLVRFWVRLQEVGVSNHLPCRKSRKKESNALKIDLIKMDGRYALENIHGFLSLFTCSCSRTVFWRAAFSLGHFHWLDESVYIAPPFGHCQRQPSYGDQLRVYWPGFFCRPLLLNFWTFLCTHTWPCKKYTADKGPQIADRPTVCSPGPCGNDDKPVEDGSKLPMNRTDSRHKLSLICVMSSIWMCITTKADWKCQPICYRLTILPLFDTIP